MISGQCSRHCQGSSHYSTAAVSEDCLLMSHRSAASSCTPLSVLARCSILVIADSSLVQDWCADCAWSLPWSSFWSRSIRSSGCDNRSIRQMIFNCRSLRCSASCLGCRSRGKGSSLLMAFVTAISSLLLLCLNWQRLHALWTVCGQALAGSWGISPGGTWTHRSWIALWIFEGSSDHPLKGFLIDFSGVRLDYASHEWFCKRKCFLSLDWMPCCSLFCLGWPARFLDSSARCRCCFGLLL